VPQGEVCEPIEGKHKFRGRDPGLWHRIDERPAADRRSPSKTRSCEAIPHRNPTDWRCLQSPHGAFLNYSAHATAPARRRRARGPGRVGGLKRLRSRLDRLLGTRSASEDRRSGRYDLTRRMQDRMETLRLGDGLPVPEHGGRPCVWRFCSGHQLRNAAEFVRLSCPRAGQAACLRPSTWSWTIARRATTSPLRTEPFEAQPDYGRKPAREKSRSLCDVAGGKRS